MKKAKRTFWPTQYYGGCKRLGILIQLLHPYLLADISLHISLLFSSMFFTKQLEWPLKTTNVIKSSSGFPLSFRCGWNPLSGLGPCVTWPLLSSPAWTQPLLLRLTHRGPLQTFKQSIHAAFQWGASPPTLCLEASSSTPCTLCLANTQCPSHVTSWRKPSLCPQTRPDSQV